MTSTLDKKIEQDRYDNRAKKISLLDDNEIKNSSIPLFLQPPINEYYKQLLKYLPFAKNVLELCCGTGENSAILFTENSNKNIYCTDISVYSLKVVKEKFDFYNQNNLGGATNYFNCRYRKSSI